MTWKSKLLQLILQTFLVYALESSYYITDLTRFDEIITPDIIFIEDLGIVQILWKIGKVREKGKGVYALVGTIHPSIDK